MHECCCDGVVFQVFKPLDVFLKPFLKKFAKRTVKTDDFELLFVEFVILTLW